MLEAADAAQRLAARKYSKEEIFEILSSDPDEMKRRVQKLIRSATEPNKRSSRGSSACSGRAKPSSGSSRTSGSVDNSFDSGKCRFHRGWAPFTQDAEHLATGTTLNTLVNESLHTEKQQCQREIPNTKICLQICFVECVNWGKAARTHTRCRFCRGQHQTPPPHNSPVITQLSVNVTHALIT